MNKCCITCNIDISNLHRNCKRCEDCQKKWRGRDRHSEGYQKEYWSLNKDKHKNRWLGYLGNPEQDDVILEFIKNKREGKPVKEYLALDDSKFSPFHNQAEISFLNDIIEPGWKIEDDDLPGVCTNNEDTLQKKIVYAGWNYFEKSTVSDHSFLGGDY